MYDDLRQKKNEYEKIIKDIEDCYAKLERCYSNLVLCRGKIKNTLSINDNFYNYKDYDVIIKNIENNIKIIKEIFLPEIRFEYNTVLSQMNNFY